MRREATDSLPHVCCHWGEGAGPSILRFALDGPRALRAARPMRQTSTLFLFRDGQGE